ncbi:DNA-methyltransferase [Fructobacillus tropaeoli]|uniref:Methyltransferase n=1 Tax=Fructobacillus tropaeoli TaxID=709323 RepID=A0A3F3H1T7_9LACO|nr:site-specific DNA-methyltransferase [Fructobacillus tropaeoli]GAP04466.1 adenine-specific methyltransferase [Fructobacillus tropaeoli]
MKTIYTDKLNTLIQSDAFKYLATLEDHSVDLIVTDPPYFLSNGGFSNSGGKMVSVNKGDWDQNPDPEQFYEKLLEEFDRILTPDGSFWIFGSMHNIYILGYLIQKKNFKILNNITWQKTNPAPNLSCRMFTHSTETILWAKRPKGKQIFNYTLMKEINDNKQMKDVWLTSNTAKSEKRFGKHPSQKPLALLKRIISASTTKDSFVVDPFVGSGTTSVACSQLGIKSVGIDNNEDYLDIARQRVADFENEKVGKIK